MKKVKLKEGVTLRQWKMITEAIALSRAYLREDEELGLHLKSNEKPSLSFKKANTALDRVRVCVGI